jgi:hypothetical protein
MSYLIKVGACRLKQCPNQNRIKGRLKVYHRFCETCNLKMLYLVFGNEIN